MKSILAWIGAVNLVLNISLQPQISVAETARRNNPDRLSQSVPVTGDFNYYFSLCSVWRSQHKYEAALSACNQAINLKKRNATLWAVRSDILLNLRQYEEALVSSLAALQIRSQDSLALTQQCRSLSALGRQDEAIAACNRALEVNKNWGEFSPTLAWISRGLAQERKQHYPQALESFEGALKVEGPNSFALVSRCRVLSEIRQYEAAIATCDRALQVNENWGESFPAQAWFWRGFAFSRWGQVPEVLGSCSSTETALPMTIVLTNECVKKNTQERWEAAVNSYEQATANAPSLAIAWAQQGANLNQLNRYAQARSSLETALKISPNYAFALVNLCAALNKLGNYQEALNACEKAWQGDGKWDESGPADAFLQRGQALAGLGQFEEALASADRALSLRPNWDLAWNAKSVILWQAQKYAEALQASDRVLEIAPNYFQGWFNRGGILNAMQRYQEAIAAYDRAIVGDLSLVPATSLASVWANRSAVLWRLGQYPEAIASANRALATDPNSVSAWFNRGLSLESMKQYEEAVNSYQQALRLDPKLVGIWVAKGMAFFHLKRYQEALNAFEEALKIDPNYLPAKQNRDLLSR
ncbi:MULTISPECIES: tetratricopeptide repeat protein [unclassified Microcoleus]|uniref:tetratricopeptide repeat protein n=1 Tax=unclassified Microcoleus TaxID=2642155 RepID=UPI002FCE781C